MAEDSLTYRFRPGCSIRKLGDLYMLIICSPEGECHALQVNDSFAFLFSSASAKESFTAGYLAFVLTEEFGLPGDEAMQEAEKTIALWREWGMLL